MIVQTPFHFSKAGSSGILWSCSRVQILPPTLFLPFYRFPVPYKKKFLSEALKGEIRQKFQVCRTTNAIYIFLITHIKRGL